MKMLTNTENKSLGLFYGTVNEEVKSFSNKYRETFSKAGQTVFVSVVG